MPRSRASTIAVLVVALGGAAAAPASRPQANRPSASGSAVAIRVLVPGRPGASTGATPVHGGVAALPSFSYPADGAVVISGATRSAANAAPAGRLHAAATAASSVVDVSLFDGEITAHSVSVKAAAAATRARAVETLSSPGIVNLQALGQQIRGGRVALGGWGVLTVGERRPGAGAPAGVKAATASVTGIDVVLLRAHDGLPAGSEIEIAVAEASAATPLPVTITGSPGGGPLPGDRPQLLPPTTGPLLGVPQAIEPPLTAAPYVFPVFGRTTYGEPYGALGPGVSYQHGVTIFGQLGQPLVAVSDGTLFSVGWSPTAGNRLWLRDAQGNEFSYEHLSAFSSLAAQGAHVRAGQVIGFMGDTGNTQGWPTHLEFEVHPVSLLFLGRQGAVDPFPYLVSWRPVTSVALSAGPGWAPSVPGTIPAPEPGAVLDGSATISDPGGVGAAALRRTLGRAGNG